MLKPGSIIAGGCFVVASSLMNLSVTTSVQSQTSSLVPRMDTPGAIASPRPSRGFREVRIQTSLTRPAKSDEGPADAGRQPGKPGLDIFKPPPPEAPETRESKSVKGLPPEVIKASEVPDFSNNDAMEAARAAAGEEPARKAAPGSPQAPVDIAPAAPPPAPAGRRS